MTFKINGVGTFKRSFQQYTTRHFQMMHVLYFGWLIVLLYCGSACTQLTVHSPSAIAGTYAVATLTFKGTPRNLIGTTLNGTLVTVLNPNSMGNLMLAPYQGIPATDYVVRNYQVFLPSVILLITNRLGIQISNRERLINSTNFLRVPWNQRIHRRRLPVNRRFNNPRC